MLDAIENAVRATFPFVVESKDRTYTVDLVETVSFLKPAPAAIGFIIQIMIQGDYDGSRQILDIKEFEVKWIYLDVQMLDEDSYGSLYNANLLLAYFTGWRSAVTKLIANHRFPDTITPRDMVPTRSKCPLRLAGNCTLDAAYFERLFLVKSRLPSLSANQIDPTG